MAVAALVGGGSSGKQLSLLQHVQAQAARSFVRAGLEVAVTGEKPKDALKQALKSTATNALGAYIAGEIGQAYKGKDFRRRYNKAQEVQECEKKLRIKLPYLPPYSPNLNPQERV